METIVTRNIPIQRFHAQARIAETVRRHSKMSEYLDVVTGDLVQQVSANIAMEDFQQEEEHVYPATWWDAVKARFAPRWFLRRWPARYVTVSITGRHIYPALLPVPGQDVITVYGMTIR